MVSIDRNGDVQTLTYNSAGQVTGVLDVGGTDIDYMYEYDALGRRTKTTDTAGGEQRYLWAPAAQRLGAGALDVEVQHLATDAANGNVLQATGIHDCSINSEQ